MYSIEAIKELREQTGLSIMDIKNALIESRGDQEKALEILKDKGLSVMKKRAEKSARQGIVESYVHQGRIGVLVVLNCETDFVARNQDFQHLAHELALQISAMKPANVQELLEQEYIRDPTQKVKDILSAMTGKVGEKIVISKFVRLELGEDN